jgi:small subunit ribosomal protein S20
VANIKSQKKRIITNEKARMRNRAVRSQLKTAIRAAREAVEAGNGAEAYAAGLNACRLLDKAAGKGVIHKNQAANRKSNLMKLVNTVVTDEDRAAYQPVKHENVVKGGTKKAANKAARKAAMEAAQAEKDKRREAQKKAEAEAAKKKAAAAAAEEAEEAEGDAEEAAE